MSLYAEDFTKGESLSRESVDPHKKTFNDSLLDSSSKKFKSTVVELLEESPYELLKNVVLNDDIPIREAIINYQPKDINVFTKKIFYRTLVIIWLKENKTQVQENVLHQNAWLLDDDDLKSCIESLENLSTKTQNAEWKFRLNYTLSLLYESVGNYKKALAKLSIKQAGDLNKNKLYLLRRRLLVCSARQGDFENYESFLNTVYSKDKQSSILDYEKKDDEFAISLLRGDDNHALVSTLIKHPDANLPRSLQSLVLSGQHQEAHLLNHRPELALSFLLSLEQYSLAKTFLKQAPHLINMNYYEKVNGFVPPQFRSPQKILSLKQEEILMKL